MNHAFRSEQANKPTESLSVQEVIEIKEHSDEKSKSSSKTGTCLDKNLQVQLTRVGLKATKYPVLTQFIDERLTTFSKRSAPTPINSSTNRQPIIEESDVLECDDVEVLAVKRPKNSATTQLKEIMPIVEINTATNPASENKKEQPEVFVSRIEKEVVKYSQKSSITCPKSLISNRKQGLIDINTFQNQTLENTNMLLEISHNTNSSTISSNFGADNMTAYISTKKPIVMMKPKIKITNPLNPMYAFFDSMRMNVPIVLSKK